MTLDQRKRNWLCLVVIFILMALVRAENFQEENHDDLEERELTLEKRALVSFGDQKEPRREFRSVIEMKKPRASLIQPKQLLYNGGCWGRPRASKNSQLRCSTYRGCHVRCLIGHRFPNGKTFVYIKCKDGKWTVGNEDWGSIPDCEPICRPPCRPNYGICVSPNVCNCSEGFSGPQCQFEEELCLKFPPIPENSRISCKFDCTISCLTGFEFPGGSSVAKMECRGGNWVPSISDWKSIPDCQSIA